MYFNYFMMNMFCGVMLWYAEELELSCSAYWYYINMCLRYELVRNKYLLSRSFYF